MGKSRNTIPKAQLCHFQSTCYLWFFFLELPSVILMRIGSISGPTDRTSTMCRSIDDFVNQDHLVAYGVGDDGGA